MAEFTLPPNSRIDTRAGKHYPAPGRRQEACARFRIYRFDPASGGRPRIDSYELDMEQLRADGARCAAEDQKRDRCDAVAAPLVPRGHLRLLRDEHQRPEHARLHQGLRRARRRRHPDLSAAAHAGGQGPGDRPDARSMRSTPPSSPGCRRALRRRRIASGCSPRRISSGSTGPRPASCAPAARPPARATGGIRSATWVRRRCWLPTAGSSTAATRLPASGSTRSRIRSGCIAAIRS